MKRLALILLILSSCSSQIEIREGYYVQETSNPEQVLDLLANSIDQYIGFYGDCKYKACIWLRKEHWNCMGMEVAGVYWGRRGDNCCFIEIGVNETDSCGTVHVLFHELKRCCFNIYTNEEWEWTYDITDAVKPLRDAGLCGKVHYEHYPWR